MSVFRCYQPAGLLHGGFQFSLEPGPAVADTSAVAQFFAAVAAPALYGSDGLGIADVTENKTSYSHGNHAGKL